MGAKNLKTSKLEFELAKTTTLTLDDSRVRREVAASQSFRCLLLRNIDLDKTNLMLQNNFFKRELEIVFVKLLPSKL